MLWLLFSLMGAVAVTFGVLPYLRSDSRRIGLIAITLACFVALAAGLYARNGAPGVPSGRSEEPDVNAMVASLSERLKSQPDDLRGWKMLGRSYMVLNRFAEAEAAFEKAVELEDAQDAQTLVDYGEAIARATGNEQLSPKAIAVFENAVTLAPDNPDALFWGGIAAINRGDPATAADRWEALLDTNPPPEIQGILRERIAGWRGEPAAAAASAAPAASADGTVITVELSLSDAARAALPDDATVFLIARDPAQPSPPIAVSRRRLSELPASIALGDRDAMIPGRELSRFPSFEVVARASLSGNPMPASGDWFASTVVEPAAGAEVVLQIDEQVP